MSDSAPEKFLPLTPVTFHILLSLHDEVKHGYGIKREVEERTRGVVRLGAGTLYEAIQRLSRARLVCETEAPDGAEGAPKRWRFYELTPTGRRVLLAELSRLEADLEYAYAKGLSTGAGGKS